MDFLKNFKRLKKVNKRILLEENDTPEDKEVAVKNAVVSSLQTKTGKYQNPMMSFIRNIQLDSFLMMNISILLKYR